MSGQLTAERLRELLHYSPETGVFTWRVYRSQKARAGGVAGCRHHTGYTDIMIDEKSYRAHRLAWLYVHGVWPVDQLDHIDGNRANNVFVNLREATQAENNQNYPTRKDNSSGFMGVTWHKAAKAWHAQIAFEGRKRNLGFYETPETAHAAYLAAKKNLHLFNPVPRKTTTGTSSNDPTFTPSRSARNC